jgi:hypothetical protein
MQNRMMFYTESCSLAYDAASNHDAEFWIIPQCFKGHSRGVKWRYPTNAELSCEVYIALATGARGIIFWKYGKSGTSPYNYIWGMHDENLNRLDLWYAVSGQINPYIKAIDSTLLQLTPHMSYTYKNDYYPPPEDAYISSISTWVHPDSVRLNPDSGWYHVGEFTDTGYDKYVMIVNRACSRGPNDPGPAPSITATVDFKTMNLRIGNYLEIIDLASNTSISDWTGRPDTARVESIRGIFTYSTVLKPGEGRLFKLIKAP